MLVIVRGPKINEDINPKEDHYNNVDVRNPVLREGHLPGEGEGDPDDYTHYKKVPSTLKPTVLGYYQPRVNYFDIRF
jgi:hypothetical protein